VTATVAGLHMRTWSNTLPRRPHADAASWRPLHGKSAFRRRVCRFAVRARQRTGCRGCWNEPPPDGGALSL